jgi:23S rRNA pseudouridine2605 synthase
MTVEVVRLQKYIADCGITSRRKAEQMIICGKVTVNDEVVKILGSKINPAEDVVCVDGQYIDRASVQKIYILLHKPRGVITSLHDPEGRDTVLKMIPEVSERVYPVGRLDYLSEGLLILTNDGDLAHRVMHPSHQVEKVYEVKVFGAVTEGLLKNLRLPVIVDGVQMAPKAVRVIKQLPGKTWLEFRLLEGKNREIRKICEAHGLTVDKLKRIAIGQLTIDGIAPGNFRYTTKRHLEKALFSENAAKAPYFSIKRTIDLKKKGPQLAPVANSEIYRPLRRESYFETLKKRQEMKAEAEAAAALAANPGALPSPLEYQNSEAATYPGQL